MFENVYLKKVFKKIKKQTIKHIEVTENGNN